MYSSVPPPKRMASFTNEMFNWKHPQRLVAGDDWAVLRSLREGRGRAPFDHHDLHGVVHDQARDHGADENRECL